jgi:hypothetical protein
MGAFADDVQVSLCRKLSARRPGRSWETEYRVGGTPVDVVGVDADDLVLVELEWRRADPADNTAKLFRHLAEGTVDAERVVAFQLFTRYYDLARGGVSAKRENAEFVGRTAADAFDRLSYHPEEFDVTPPKRGGERPAGWRAATDAVAGRICDRLDEHAAQED